MGKKSKHPVYDDPTAFAQRWPRIVETQASSTALSLANPSEKMYKMGPVRCSVIPPGEDFPGYFMTVRCNSRYPTWDEIVWLRYNLIPDAAIMSLVLPNLNRYINREDNGHKFVFTLEQKGWALDPQPYHCGQPMAMIEESLKYSYATFECADPTCGHRQVVDFKTWNEQHGNGFGASEVSF